MPDRRLRILALTKSTGGLAQYNRTLCVGLGALGHEVHVACMSDNADTYARELNGAGVATSVVPMSRYRIAPGSDVLAMKRVMSLARKLAPDVIVAHGAKPGFIGRLSGRLGGVPTVYAMHSLPFLERVQGRRARVYAILERLASATFGGRIVALTDSMRKLICAAGHVAEDRVSVIYTGIDTDHYRRLDRTEACITLGLDPARPVIGWSGRFTRQKAPERFVAIAERVGAKYPDAQFVMAGAGAGDIAQHEARGVPAASLSFLPWMSDPRQLYSACDVYVLTSRWEGLPLSLLESMAAGCPVVSTDVDGVGEAVRSGTDGLLCADGDLEGLAAAVETLIGDAGRRRALACAARERVRDAFCESAMIENWQALLLREVTAG